MRSSTTKKSSVHDYVIKSVIGELQHQGISSVRAKCDGFVLPERVRWDDGDDGIVPDIVVEHDGATHVFEFEMGDELNEETAEDRWRLLTAFAHRSQGRFYLIIPERRENDLRSFMRHISVRPEILKVKGIA